MTGLVLLCCYVTVGVLWTLLVALQRPRNTDGVAMVCATSIGWLWPLLLVLFVVNCTVGAVRWARREAEEDADRS